MELPLVLLHNGGASPALVVADLVSGERRAIPSALDGRVVTDRFAQLGDQITCSGWVFPADFSGEARYSGIHFDDIDNGDYRVVWSRSGVAIETVKSQELRELPLPNSIDSWPSSFSGALSPAFDRIAMKSDDAMVFVELATGVTTVVPIGAATRYSNPLWLPDGSAVVVVGESHATIIDATTLVAEQTEIAIRGDSQFAKLVLGHMRSLEELPNRLGSAPSHPGSVDEARKLFDGAIDRLSPVEQSDYRENALLSLRMLHDYEKRGEVVPGKSRFGGRPDAPLGFEWPHEDGLPLFFFAQLHLADIAAFDSFPIYRDGHVLVFYRPPDTEGVFHGAVSVFHHVSEEAETAPVEWPDALTIAERIAAQPMLLVPEYSLNDRLNFELGEVIGETPFAPPPLHRIFGWGDFQNSDEHQLVFQIDADNYLGLPHFGDGGITAEVVDLGSTIAPDFSNGGTLFNYEP